MKRTTRRRRIRKKKNKIEEALKKSPINYFSDLFIVAMVLAWIVVLFIMLTMAIYSTIKLSDNSIWPDVGNLAAIPLTAGGAIWMIKNSVQHAIMAQKGKACKSDFPAVNAEGQDDGIEQSPDTTNKEREELG